MLKVRASRIRSSATSNVIGEANHQAESAE